MTDWKKLGVIAGAGALPIEIASACSKSGTDFHVIRLAGVANEALSAFPGSDFAIGEAGAMLDGLKAAGCDAIVFAGVVRRPDFSKLKVDWRGAKLLPKVIAAAAKGDGHILDVLASTVEAEGFALVGADSVVKGLTAPPGPLGKHKPSDQNLADIKKAAQLIAALGDYDVGQGAVIANGLVLAIEAAEGTDEMLHRCAALPNGVSKGGVLTKRPKPNQELRIDLPAIGPETIKHAANAGLAGVAVESGHALVLDKSEVIALADAAGLFVYGFSADECTAIGT